MSSQPLPRETRWHVRALATPPVRRHCPGCHEEQPFASSDRFRLNANGRRLDAWLIYRCPVCDQRWNRELFARVAPAALGPACLRSLQDNDRHLAWRHAFDRDGLSRLGARADFDVPVHIDVEPGLSPHLRILLHHPVAVRLDKLLAQGLGVSRSQLQRWHRAGRLRIPDATRRPLRHPVHHGQRVELEEGLMV